MPAYIQSDPKTKLLAEQQQKAKGAVLQTTPPQIGFVLDASSSMEPLADAAISSFNILISEQQKLCLEAKFSLSTFNSSVHPIYNTVPLPQVPLLTHSLYEPDGATALNDAIAEMIRTISKAAPSRSTRALIAILTDGAENSSRTSIDDVASMITYRRTTYDWQFVFIGPEAAHPYALRIGIPKSNIVSFDTDQAGIAAIIAKLSKSMQRYLLGDKRYHLALTNG